MFEPNMVFFPPKKRKSETRMIASNGLTDK